MNKKGFTLIEILAVIVIIGIMATVGIIAISGSILKSRDASFVDLAKVYAESARTMRATDEMFYDPKSGEAIIIPYASVVGSEIENKDVTGYGNIIDSYCYIGVVNENSNYKYYVTQVDDTYHIIDRVEYNSIDEENIFEGVDELSSREVRNLKAPFNGMYLRYGNSDYTIKAIRVEFDATISKNQPDRNQMTNIKVTEFGKMGLYNKEFAGSLKLYKYHGENTVELKVIRSEDGNIAAKKYTATEKLTGNASNFVGQWKISSTSSANQMILDIKNVSDSSVSFDIKVNNKVIYQNVVTTDKTTLPGQYYTDSKFNVSSVAAKGSISDYDSFKSSGKFASTNSNKVTYDGVVYELNDSKLVYAIAKKN